MTCEWVQIPGGGSAIVCRDGRRRRCSVCGQLGAPKLCDGSPPPGAGRKTCDAPLCAKCATGVEDQDLDFCPAHAEAPMPTCRSCGQEVIWARMPSGKLNPVDPEPRPDGNLILFRNAETGKVRAEVVAAGEERLPAGAVLRVSHFVTCVSAAKHRRKP